MIGHLVGGADLAGKIAGGEDREAEGAVAAQRLHHDRARIADGEADFLRYLADGALLDAFAWLDAATGQGPEMLIGRIGALDEQHLSVADKGDAGGVGDFVGHIRLICDSNRCRLPVVC